MSKLTPNVPHNKKHRSVFRRLMSGWSFLVWVGMIAVTYLCYTHGGSFLPLNGQVVVVKENVSCMETARLCRILVSPGQEVKRGDVIAVLDPSLSDLKIAELRAKLRRQRQMEGLEALDRQRRLMTDAQDLRKNIYEAEIRQERDKSTREALAERYQTLAGLIKKGLVSDTEYFRVGVELAGLDPKLGKYPEIIAQYQQDLADVLRMRKDIEAAGLTLHTEPDEETLRTDIEDDPQMHVLRFAKDDLTLRAAADGSIGRINFQIGEVVATGAVVVEIIKHGVPTVETFVPETLTIHVAVGQEFRISSLTDPKKYYRATVTSITPQIVGQADKANSMTERVIRGRRLVLTPSGITSLLPGESVMIEGVPKPWF